NLQDVIALEFELPEGCGRVSANAEIAWTRDNGHLSGARFVNLDDDSRAQLSRWIEDMASAPSLESRCEEPVIVATEVLEPEVAGSGVVEPELAAPEFTKIEEQASLFHVQAVENRP